ncbi:MAG: phospholipase D-like domain-containing protein [Jannaschia helgolandensis]|uniref:phospholipase D family protein n=1 Tax=Jannaschia helgolandensis TaxID=188906 RepID=UPI003C77E0FD
MSRTSKQTSPAIIESTPLLTASQGFPALERLFLNAESRISLGFRIFDPRTRLHSPEARTIGKDWFDLIVHTLKRGVEIDLVLSDFDAIVRPDYHQRATRCVRLALAAAEVAGHPERLRASASLHPARIGWLPSLALWVRARGFLLRTGVELNALSPAARTRRLSELPQLRPYFIEGDERKVTLKSLKLPRLCPVSHHQKVAVADGNTLYIGGLDLNDRRYDTPDHNRPASETWHDTQLLIRGPVAAQTEAHLANFRDVTYGAPPVDAPDLLRTISRRRKTLPTFMSPLPVLSELAEAHAARARAATGLIYLESQFFRDTSFARLLARKARRTPALSMVLILPAAPDDIAFKNNSGSDAKYGEFLQAKCVSILRKAFGDRLFIGSPAQRRKAEENSRATTYGAPLIYLHAKVSIFDDTAAIVSSANLNGRSFRWDTEAGVTLTDPAHIEDLKTRCISHWLDGPVPEAFLDPKRAVDAWWARAHANARRAPEDRDGYILPYASAPARRFGRNLPGIPEEMV